MENPFTFEIEEAADFETTEAGDYEAEFGQEAGTEQGSYEEGLPEKDFTEEEIQYSIIISPTSPGDSRVRVAAVTTSRLSTLNFPFASICLIEVERNGKFTPWGSGSLIAPQVVLTARHVLLKDEQNRVLEPKVRITPGADLAASAASKRTPASPAQQVASSSRLKVDASLDYGIVALPRPFSRPAQSMLLEPSKTFPNGSFLNVAGFPGDKPPGTMWLHSEPVLTSGFTSTHLKYTMDTCPGHSGSPVWAKMPD